VDAFVTHDLNLQHRTNKTKGSGLDQRINITIKTAIFTNQKPNRFHANVPE
jgi:hypothetical protein